MQPYQKAAEAIRSGEEKPLHILKNAGLAAIGGGAAKLGAKALGGIVPAIGALINKYVPDNIMEAGLKKINPSLGTFMEGARQAGYTTDDLRSYLTEKLDKSQEHAKEDRNIIEQVSPELHQFIKEHVAGGRGLHQAGSIASKDKRFMKHIKELTKQHKLSWADLLEQVYGPNPTNLNKEKKNTVASEESDRFNQAYGDQQGQTQQQPQQGQGLDPGVAQILQQGNELLKRFRGQG